MDAKNGKDIVKRHNKTLESLLVPTHILPHLKIIDVFARDDNLNERISNEEKNKGTNWATAILLEALVKSKQEDWYDIFVKALEDEGFEIIVKTLNGHILIDHDLFMTYRSRNFLEISKVNFTDVFSYLIETRCLSSRDEEEAQTQYNKCNTEAMEFLLYRMPKKKEHWFAGLMYALFHSLEMTHYVQIAKNVHPKFAAIRNDNFHDFVHISNQIDLENKHGFTKPSPTEVADGDVDDGELTNKLKSLKFGKEYKKSEACNMTTEFCNGTGIISEDSIEQNILDYLRREIQPRKAHEIAKAVGFSVAKDVNPVLYKLQREHKVESTQDKLWALKSTGANNIDKVANLGKDQKDQIRQKCNASKSNVSNLSELDQKIVDFLEKQNTPVKTLAIVNAVAYPKPKVNSALYGLQKQGIVIQNTPSPPTWSLEK